MISERDGEVTFTIQMEYAWLKVKAKKDATNKEIEDKIKNGEFIMDDYAILDIEEYK